MRTAEIVFLAAVWLGFLSQIGLLAYALAIGHPVAWLAGLFALLLAVYAAFLTALFLEVE